jgi:hypothetical protein
MAQHASVNEPTSYTYYSIVLATGQSRQQLQQPEALSAYIRGSEAERAKFGFDRRFTRAKRLTFAILIVIYVIVLAE